MTGTENARGKITLRSAAIVLIVLVYLLQLSLWADQKATEVEGPLRMVSGPQETVYIQIDRRIAKVSSDGDVLQVLDLDSDAAIPEQIADYFVEENGNLLIARRDSQIMQSYSPEGKLIKTHLRVPSALVEGDHFCKLTKDRATGILYFADTSHHRIQIYGHDEKELKTIYAPSGVSKILVHGEEPDTSDSMSADTALRYPNGLLFDRDRLIATDTGNRRIVFFYPDGTLDKIIPVVQDGTSSLTNAFRVARFGDRVYAIMRGPNFLGGNVAVFDQNTRQGRAFLQGKSLDPWDVFPRTEDVLVADRESLSVLRYTPEGAPLGTFGKPSLLGLYADRQVARKTFRWIRTASLGSMLVVLGWLLTASRRQRLVYDAAGQSLHQPIASLQRVLGPVGSVRRNVLLFCVPGLGQAAAGRTLRAVMWSIIMLYFLSLVVYSWFEYSAGGSLPVLINIALMVYMVWMVAVLDGVRLSGRAGQNRRLRFNRALAAFAAPLITVGVIAVIQFAREFLVRGNPELSLRTQAIFGLLMNVSSREVAPFVTMIPASLVFGWGGAAAGMVAVLSWQARMPGRNIVVGTAYGFLAGIIGWIITVLLVWNTPGALFYQAPVQGALMGLVAYIYLRNSGMPMLVVPMAAAGAWFGDFLRLVSFSLDRRLMGMLLTNGMDAVWTGAISRIEFLIFPAFFIHLAIWAAWNAASERPVGKREETATGE